MWPPCAVTHLPLRTTLVNPSPLPAAALKTSHAWSARMPETIRSPPGASDFAITGQAWIYGRETLRLSPDDPFATGFALSDTWGPQVAEIQDQPRGGDQGHGRDGAHIPAATAP